MFHTWLPYLVCTVPRSGSWLLCTALRRTGEAGSPEEYFWDMQRPRYAERWGLPEEPTDTAYIDAALWHGSTANGVFGAKVHWFQLRQLLARLRAEAGGGRRSARRLLEDRFGPLTYIRLRRQDKVRQAISYYRALETGEWWRTHGAPMPEENVLTIDTVDLIRVRELETMLVQHEARWTQFFTDAGIRPLVVTYEELSEDYVPTVRRVLDHLGLYHVEVAPQTMLARQADGTTEDLVQRYVTARRSFTVSDPELYGRGFTDAFVAAGTNGSSGSNGSNGSNGSGGNGHDPQADGSDGSAA